MNLTTIIGVFIGFGALIGGFLLEGGQIGSLILLSPAIIVFGGTVGATVISYQSAQLKRLPKKILSAFRSTGLEEIRRTADTLVEIAETVKVNGFLSLEAYAESHQDMNPVLLRGIMLLMDGADSELLESEMEAQIAVIERSEHTDISVLEAMGGFSPTMGVVGTVMGLIQTLSQMGSPEELTHAIAVAFIATLYGVGFANLLYIPLASKLKINLKNTSIGYELMVKGLVSVQKGQSARIIKEMMEPYLVVTGLSDGGDN